MTPGDALRDALVDTFGLDRDDFRDDALLEQDLALDSLALVELQVVVEDALGVRVHVRDPGSLSTFGELATAVEAAAASGVATAPRLSLVEDDEPDRGVA